MTEHIQILVDNFVKHMVLEPIKGPSPFGLIEGNWNCTQLEDAKNLFKEAADPNTELIVDTHFGKCPKTWKPYVSITIMENENQKLMLMNRKEVSGKAITLRINKNYSPSVFSQLDWFGNYYDGKLCGQLFS